MTQNVSLGSDLPVAESTLVKISRASYTPKQGRLLLEIDGFKPLDLPNVDNEDNYLSYDEPGGIIGQELRMQVYYNEDTNQAVIAYAGTDSATDLIGTDSLFIDGGIDNQITESILKTNEAIEYLALKYEITPGDITVTGHSLGGGIAQINASIHGFSGSTQDAPESSQITESAEFIDFIDKNKIQIDPSAKGANFVNHTEQGSVVSDINALLDVEVKHYGKVVEHNTTGGDQSTEERLAHINEVRTIMEEVSSIEGTGDFAAVIETLVQLGESVANNHFLVDNFLPEFTSPAEFQNFQARNEAAKTHGKHLEAIQAADNYITDKAVQVNSDGTISVEGILYRSSNDGWYSGDFHGNFDTRVDASESMGQTLDALSRHHDGETFENLQQEIKDSAAETIDDLESQWQNSIRTTDLVDENGNVTQITEGPDFIEITTNEGRLRFYEDGRQAMANINKDGEAQTLFRRVDGDYYESFQASIGEAVTQNSVSDVAREVDQSLGLDNADTATDEVVEHEVAEGDTLSEIAGQFPNVSWEEIAAANNIDLDNPVIQPGQILVIPSIENPSESDGSNDDYERPNTVDTSNTVGGTRITIIDGVAGETFEQSGIPGAASSFSGGSGPTVNVAGLNLLNPGQISTEEVVHRAGVAYRISVTADAISAALEAGDTVGVLEQSAALLDLVKADISTQFVDSKGVASIFDSASNIASVSGNVVGLSEAIDAGDEVRAVAHAAQLLTELDGSGWFGDAGFLNDTSAAAIGGVAAAANFVLVLRGDDPLAEFEAGIKTALEIDGYLQDSDWSLDLLDDGFSDGLSSFSSGLGAATSLYDVFNADNIGDGLVSTAEFAINLQQFSQTSLGGEILGAEFAAELGQNLATVVGVVLAVKNGIDAFNALDDGDYDQAAISASNAVAAGLAVTPLAWVGAIIVLHNTVYQIADSLGVGWAVDPVLSLLNALEPDKIGSARAVSDGEGGFDIVTGGNKDAFEDQAESILSGIAESFTEATENLPAGLVLIPERLPQIRVENGEIQIVYIDGNTGKMYVDKDVDQDAIGERLGEIIASYEHFYGADWFYGPEWEAETTRLKGHTNEARQSLDKDGHTEGGAMPYFLPELPVEQINWDDGTFMVTIADLDGDGAEIVDSNTAHFDIDGDGYREPFETWVGPDDAIVGFNHSGAGAFASYQDFFNGNWGYLDTGLAASQANALQGLNADGTEQDPNNYEYFWNQDEEWSGGPDGYYDYVDTTKAPTDGRGEVDASDPAYREFLLWQDVNQDGIRDEGEGQTLTQIGVVAVRLNEATGLWEAHTSDNRVIPFYQKDLRFGSNGIREMHLASGTLRLFENGGGECEEKWLRAA